MPHSTFQQRGTRVLVAAEGSGGHLMPALEVSRALVASGVGVCLLYAQRASTAGLFQDLLEDAQEAGVALCPVPLGVPRLRMARSLWRLWQAGRLWQLARATLGTIRPQVVVGFGGWLCVPVVAAARQQRLPVLLHEQNVRLGRANRALLRWVDTLALSFSHTRRELHSTHAVVTGLPVRRTIGAVSREEAARRFGMEPDSTTLLVLGGSQGSGPINRLVCDMLRELTDDERASWQVIHLTGPSDEAAVRAAYTAAGVRGWVAAHLVQMEAAYALAHVVVARAGASTIAELAQCGTPALLIPYPYANGHQRENVRLVESVGAGVGIEESLASPQRVLTLLRKVLLDRSLQQMMGAQMRSLAQPDATQRLASAIHALATAHTHAASPASSESPPTGTRPNGAPHLVRGRAMVSSSTGSGFLDEESRATSRNEGTESNHAQR